VSGLENGSAQNRLDGVGGDRPKLAQIAAPFDGDHRQLKQPADDDERHVRRQRVGSDLGLLATPRLDKGDQQLRHALDRRSLGRLVFSDPESLAALESIVHPAINELLERIVRQTGEQGPPAMALEAVKLVEAGHAAHCDEVWLITCAPRVQLARLVGRGMSEADARQRIEAQAPSLPLWRAAATRTIGTDGPRDEVERAVGQALDEALARQR